LVADKPCDGDAPPIVAHVFGAHPFATAVLIHPGTCVDPALQLVDAALPPVGVTSGTVHGCLACAPARIATSTPAELTKKSLRFIASSNCGQSDVNDFESNTSVVTALIRDDG